MADEKPVTFRLGGEDIVVPPFEVFATWKRAWPAVVEMAKATGEDVRVAAGVRVLSAALIGTRPELTPNGIEERLRIDRRTGQSEADAITGVVDRLIIMSGLYPQGEALPAKGPGQDGDQAAAQ